MTNRNYVRPNITEEDRTKYAGMVVAISCETGKVVDGKQSLPELIKAMKECEFEFVTHGLPFLFAANLRDIALKNKTLWNEDRIDQCLSAANEIERLTAVNAELLSVCEAIMRERPPGFVELYCQLETAIANGKRK